MMPPGGADDQRIFAGAFINNGALEVRQGRIKLGDCCTPVTNAGSYDLASNSEIVFRGKVVFNENSRITADAGSTLVFEATPATVKGVFDVGGTVELTSSGSLGFTNNVTIPTLVIDESFSNSISGPGQITVTDEFQWKAGNISAGTLISQGTTTIGDLPTGFGLSVGSGAVFVNQGDATWQAGSLTLGNAVRFATKAP